MKKDVAVAEKIHEEFHGAFENAESELDVLIENKARTLNKGTVETYTSLKSAGIGSKEISIIEEESIIANRESANRERIENTSNELREIKLKFPYKVISYSQIIKILEKYNLYIGSAEFYEGSIPEMNAKDVLKYRDSMDDSGICGQLDTDAPICSQAVQSRWSPSFYMCAPLGNFKKKDRAIIGKEVFYDHGLKTKFVLEREVTDPIIVSPLFLKGALKEPLFHVVTAWGPEAKEAQIFNEQLN